MLCELGSPSARVAARQLTPGMLFTCAVCITCLVNDGWSGRPSPRTHQLYLLPFTAAFAAVLWPLLKGWSVKSGPPAQPPFEWPLWLLCSVSIVFELLSVSSFAYERRHFAKFGYNGSVYSLLFVVGVGALFIAVASWRRTPGAWLATVVASYAAGQLLAIRYFPLNYLRSDMLPVIAWADERLVHHLNPYATMHVGARLYDFPYLPGMLLAYLPAVAAGLDVRWISVACVICLGLLLYYAALKTFRKHAAALCGIFMLAPFLQYRHDLYLQPHWLCLVASIVLLQRKRFGWAVAVFGISMAIYQLSWVLFPFIVLYAWRNGGWRRAGQAVVIGLGSMLLVVGPFLHSAMSRIESNTVGQWSRLPHALADPMNLSYWLTFLVRPDQLKWVQLVVMSFIFGFCIVMGRCQSLTDTLRWMSAALALFIAINVLVDGYFYLTLLLLLLMYTLAASGIWAEPTSLTQAAD